MTTVQRPSVPRRDGLAPSRSPTTTRRRAWACTLVTASLACTAGGATWAGPAAAPRGDHDWARDAVRAGEIRSLAEILKRLEREFHGQVVEIELDREAGRIVYEIELLTPAGHVIELVYDARTGVLLQASGRDLDKARRQVRLAAPDRP